MGSGKLWRGVVKSIDFLIVLLLSAMTFVVAAAVFCRYVLFNPIAWAEEFSRYCMIYLAMLGATVALRDNAHVGVSVIIDLFPAKIRRGILQFGRVFIIIFLAAVVVFSISHAFTLQGQTSSAMQLPMAVPYFAITLGAFLMLLVAVRQFLGIDKVKSENEATLDEIKESLADTPPTATLGQ